MRARPVPTRTCVVCRTARPKRDLLRVVRTSDGSVVADPTGRLNGRGAYVCDDPACRERAITTNALSRALKTTIQPGALREALASGADSTMTTGGANGTK